MKNIFDILAERGFIEQATHEQEIKELLGKESVTFYIGFDPTADSLHVGHFIQVIVMMHMQRAGHKPVALLGGGTAKIGDPSGKNDMRKMMTDEIIDGNLRKMKSQMDKYLILDGEKGHFVNNADWLDNLNYIEFLREIGSKFSVNKMLSADCFKSRMENGLTFLEFNYMIMQSYDFLELNRRYNCKLQMGGNDQWSNIIGGVNLIRKVESDQAFGLTFKLLTTSEGKKMGKTEKGAIWIDPEKTSPYELYQYFRNVDDADVINCLKLLTFLPLEKIDKLAKLEGQEINEAKEVLAFEFTKLVHGEEEAQKAEEAAKALFGSGSNLDDMPSSELSKALIEEGTTVVDVMVECGLIKSKGEGKRLIKQGGVSLNGEKVSDPFGPITDANLDDESSMIIKKGKKVFHKVLFK